MKRSHLKNIIREEIINKLRETTMVDKTTDLNKVVDIAKREKKDPNIIRTAISQAKTSGKPVNIDEGSIIATDYQLTDQQLKFLKSQGVIQNGSNLYIPGNIYDELNKHNSDFKKEFESYFPLKDKSIASNIITAIKKSIIS